MTVTLLRPPDLGGAGAEAAPAAVVGTFSSGQAHAVLGGTYDLVIETEPAHVERGVRVEPGTGRLVSIVVPSARDTRGGR